MASPPQRHLPENEVFDHSDFPSIATSVGTPDEGYPLTRQPGSTTARHCNTSVSVPLSSNNTTETILKAPVSSGTAVAEKEIMTMSIALKEVKLVQLFLRPDGSVKGISFIYEDADLAGLGCCEAEPDCWHMFFRPQYLLFTPTPGYAVGREFFPVESISFAEAIDGPEIESKAIEMRGSVMLRLSPGGLEMDIGSHVVERTAVQHIEVLHGTKSRLEKVVSPPTNTTESGSQAVNNRMNVKCRRRVLERVGKALKSWFGMRSVIDGLPTRVRRMERKHNQ